MQWSLLTIPALVRRTKVKNTKILSHYERQLRQEMIC